MNWKAVIPLVAGLGIGGFALKIGIDTLQRARGAQVETAAVWAAKSEIPRGTKIREEMLTTLTYPAKLLPKGAIRQKDQLIGRVPRVDAPAGLPVLEGMLFPPGDPGGIHVPPGFRAVAVRIDEASGVDGHLKPGDHVDVVAYYTVRAGSKTETFARTVIENVEVAAVGPRISAVGGEGEEKGARPTRAVTLLLRSDKAPILHLVEQRGKIKLCMRGEEEAESGVLASPINEEDVLDPEGAAQRRKQQEVASAAPAAEKPALLTQLQGLFAKSKPVEPDVALAAAPPVAPQPGWVVYVWRGNKVEEVRFRSRESRERVPGEGNERGVRTSPSKPSAPSTSVSSPPAPAVAPEPEAASAGDEQEGSFQEPSE